MSMFFDLQRNLTTNVDFANKTQKLLNDVTLAEKSGDEEDLAEAVTELLRHCRWNPGLLVPYFFPKYPEDKPMTLWSRPHSFSMLAVGSNAVMTIQSSRQVGKCLSFSTNVLRRSSTGKEEEISIKNLFDEAKNSAKIQN